MVPTDCLKKGFCRKRGSKASDAVFVALSELSRAAALYYPMRVVMLPLAFELERILANGFKLVVGFLPALLKDSSES